MFSDRFPDSILFSFKDETLKVRYLLKWMIGRCTNVLPNKILDGNLYIW